MKEITNEVKDSVYYEAQHDDYLHDTLYSLAREAVTNLYKNDQLTDDQIEELTDVYLEAVADVYKCER